MSDRSVLLAAVLASPDDDTPRLIYADYLDETGDPADAARAEFIRLEIEADGLPTVLDERQELERRSAVLLRQHVDAWNRELPGWIGDGARVFYKRGFPAELQMDYDQFGEWAADLFDVAPIQTVELTASRFRVEGFDWAAVRRPELLRRVRRLGLSPFSAGDGGLYGPGSPRALCRVRELSGLRVLDLGLAGVTDDWVIGFVRAFPSAAFADTLDELLLPDNRVTDAGAQALAAAPGLGRLRRLDLRNNHFSPIGGGPLVARYGNRLVV